MEELALWPKSVQETLRVHIERNRKPRSLLKRIGKNAGNMTCKRWFNANTIDLLDRMLMLTPCKRLTAEQVLEHMFFKGGSGNVLEPYEMVLLPFSTPVRALEKGK